MIYCYDPPCNNEKKLKPDLFRLLVVRNRNNEKKLKQFKEVYLYHKPFVTTKRN